jgi:hypothetical protein
LRLLLLRLTKETGLLRLSLRLPEQAASEILLRLLVLCLALTEHTPRLLGLLCRAEEATSGRLLLLLLGLSEESASWLLLLLLLLGLRLPKQTSLLRLLLLLILSASKYG